MTAHVINLDFFIVGYIKHYEAVPNWICIDLFATALEDQVLKGERVSLVLHNSSLGMWLDQSAAGDGWLMTPLTSPQTQQEVACNQKLTLSDGWLVDFLNTFNVESNEAMN